MRGSPTVRAAAVAGGGVGAVAIAGYGVLVAEATLARRVIGHRFGDQGPDADGWYEPPTRPDAGPRNGPLQCAVLGDSGAAGLGVDSPSETPGALIAAGLAAASGRRVRLRGYAVVGARSSDLANQLDRLAADAAGAGFPEVAVLVIGANDIVNQVRIATAARALGAAVARLRHWGVDVVVGTCPDLGTLRPVAQPLRLVARGLSRQLARAQTVAAVSAGATTVSLGGLLGPVFDAAPDVLFSADRFHPSAAGYARMAEALLPSVTVAAGVVGAPRAPGLAGVDPVELGAAASIAVERAGAEITAAEPNGRRTGPWGTWVQIRRRSLDAWKDVPGSTADDEVGRVG